MRPLSILFVLLSGYLKAQLTFSDRTVDLGEVGAVYEVAGDVIVTNSGDKKVYILRATSDEHIRVYTSKRTLQPGDTALVVMSYLPQSAGRFSKRITLLTTDEAGSHELRLAGNIQKVRQNDLTACYYFGSRSRRVPATETVFFRDTLPVRTATPAQPIRNIPKPRVTEQAPEAIRRPPVTAEPVKTESGPLAGHRPNNILLLIDISSSMRDSLKLPLMKSELHKLIDAIRDVDTVTLVTYADSVKVRAEAISGTSKERLHEVVKSLKARGQTKGKKAILFSQELSQKHFIRGGNNLLILASDGKFMFTPEDQLLWNERQSKGEITITTVAFGQDREAMRTLRQIARKGNGTFIHITKRSKGNERLLEEIRERSRPADGN